MNYISIKLLGKKVLQFYYHLVRTYSTVEILITIKLYISFKVKKQVF